MPSQPYPILDLRTRRRWRAWLAKHHAASAGVWLLFHKRHTGVETLGYDEAVEEALCFGWIDSIIKRLDDERYLRKFTPRRPGSVWSALNRRRYADLEKRGLLAKPGMERAPEPAGKKGREAGEAVEAVDVAGAAGAADAAVPAYFLKALDSHPGAREHFRKLAPSYRKLFVRWIDSAKREETRARRLAEALRLLAAGKKLGMK